MVKPSPEPTRPSRRTRSRGIPALVVDANPSGRELARVVLRDEGCDVRLAFDAGQALAEIAARKPRVIVIDLQLPDIDGVAFVQLLKSAPETHDIVIVALTGYAMPKERERAMAAGSDGAVTKPIDVRSFRSTLAKVLPRRKQDSSREPASGDCA